MCGIFGEYRFDKSPLERHRYYLALEQLRSRGPDHQDLAFFERTSLLQGTTLGHTRLSIIDLSQKANQPLKCTESRYLIVFNGTIFNYKKLRAELLALGMKFNTHSDTEVILNGYKYWRGGVVDRLNGIFAFAIYDTKKHELFMARDKFGVKPCYYHQGKGFFRFASNTKALTCFNDISLELDYQALHYQFSFHGSVQAPFTVFKNIRKLPPAHYLTISPKGDVEITRYWTLESNFDYLTNTPPSTTTTVAINDTIEELLSNAIYNQVNANDVKVGVLLSGGLDSSLITGILSQKFGITPEVYSIGFSSQPEEKGNEFYYSDMVANHCNAKYNKIYMTDKEILNNLNRVINSMSEPVFAQDATGFFLLANEVSKNHKVVLSGQGADEVFAGYTWYPKIFNDATIEGYYRHYVDRSHSDLLAMVNFPENTPDYSLNFIKSNLESVQSDKQFPNPREFINKVLHLDITTLIVDDPVKRVDNMTMSCGLEARVPFLDQYLVKKANKLPPELKLAKGGKGILKSIAEKYLPAEVIHREKENFPVPSLKFVRGGVFDLINDTLNDHITINRGLFNRRKINSLLKNPNNAGRTPIGGNSLWHLASFELWLRNNMVK